MEVHWQLPILLDNHLLDNMFLRGPLLGSDKRFHSVAPAESHVLSVHGIAVDAVLLMR